MERREAACRSYYAFPPPSPAVSLPPLETLVDGFGSLSLSSPAGDPTPGYDAASSLYSLGYCRGSHDMPTRYLDLLSEDGHGLGTSLASDVPTSLRKGVNPVASAWSPREVRRSNDLFCVDRGDGYLGGFSGYPRGFLRRNLYVGRYAGIDTSPCCSLPLLSRTSIRDLRGVIGSIAKSRTGHKVLREQMKDMNAEDAEIVFCDLFQDLGELIVDPFASHVIQELVDVCNDEQRVRILSSVTRNPQLIRICQDQYGAPVIKKLLEILTPDWQKQEFLWAIRPGAVQLAKNTNGHHLILHILKVFPAYCNQVLLDRLNDKFYEIATDQHGCHVVIKHIQNVKGDRFDHMVAETVARAFTLSEHCYGNYVVQALLNAEMPPQLLHDLQHQFTGSYFALSRDKYGSNVVERCLSRAEDRDFMHIICELLDDFLLLLTDEYANYVAQKMTARSKALCMPVYGILVDRIRSCRPLIESSIYGRKALERLKKNNDIHI
ncbi:hypothetical protein MLD38_024725 [Melastoma candidum]|uniref:Uncharacterized protein n=1 Tax=Melastoma candidum TaxID=119954 RepID=A0ACB9NU56_9MYRT|nr:hypothetical protein MLD38_024725 [Melastoma candidum]